MFFFAFGAFSLYVHVGARAWGGCLLRTQAQCKGMDRTEEVNVAHFELPVRLSTHPPQQIVCSPQHPPRTHTHTHKAGMRRCSPRGHGRGLLLLLLLGVVALVMGQPHQNDWKAHLLHDTDARLHGHATARLATLLDATETSECAEEVALSYEAFLTAHMTETLLPFESPFAKSLCPRPEEPTEIPEVYAAPDALKLLYVISAHRDLDQVVRLIQALQDDPDDDGCGGGLGSRKADDCVRNHFVVHVDGKVGALDPDSALLQYAAVAPNVYVMREGRVNVSWGGFSVVQATLNAMSYGFYLDLPFDRVINLSGATYPLATPRQIRATLAQHPINEQLMFIDPVPNVPNPRVWHYFVECDNKMHRIARFGLPRGVPLRTGSQWFIISRAFAHYILTDETFVAPYTAYVQHVLIPDENFFATVLKSSRYCHLHNNTNYLHLTFDVWEDEKGDAADLSKCLQPDPSICGRSPLLVGLAEVAGLIPDALGSRGNETSLFARKFDSVQSAEVLDEIDRRLNALRQQEREDARACGNVNGESSCRSGAGGVSTAAAGAGTGTASVLREHGIALETIKW